MKKTIYDLRIYERNDKGEIKRAYTLYGNIYGFYTLKDAFKAGAEIYNRAEMNLETKFAGFNIVYEDCADELIEVSFRNDYANYRYNNSEGLKLIKEYLPQIDLKAAMLKGA